MTDNDFLTTLFLAKRQLEGEGFKHTAEAVANLLALAQADAGSRRQATGDSEAA